MRQPWHATFVGLGLRIRGLFFQSLVVENLLQKERRSETKEQQSEAMRYDRTWWIPVQQRLRECTSKYQPVPWQSIQLTEQDPKAVSAELSKPLLKRLSDPRLREVVSTSKTTSWPTFTPNSQAIQVSSLMSFVNATQHDPWGRSPLWWMSALLPVGTLVRARMTGSPWVFSLGTVEGMCCLGWPAQEVKVGKATSYRPATDCSLADLRWLVVDD